MTNRAEHLAADYLEDYEQGRVPARAAEIERLMQLAEDDGPTGAAVAYELLGAVGFALGCVVLYFREPLWQLVSELPWWGWAAVALAVLLGAASGVLRA